MAVYAFEKFELDLRLYELRRDGERCPLEPQVFDLLAYLVRHHDRLVTRAELLDVIWGHRYITEASLSSRLMAARKALEDTGQEQRFIRTVRGRGYRFIAPVVERVLAAAPDNVHAYRQGRAGLLGWFVGQVMKESGGRANPQLARQLLLSRLAEPAPPAE